VVIVFNFEKRKYKKRGSLAIRQTTSSNLSSWTDLSCHFMRASFWLIVRLKYS